MRIGRVVAGTILVASSVFAQAPTLVELTDARFNVSALGPTGWTFTARNAANVVIRGAAGTIDISVASSAATGMPACDSYLASRSTPFGLFQDSSGRKSGGAAGAGPGEERPSMPPDVQKQAEA